MSQALSQAEACESCEASLEGEAGLKCSACKATKCHKCDGYTKATFKSIYRFYVHGSGKELPYSCKICRSPSSPITTKKDRVNELEQIVENLSNTLASVLSRLAKLEAATTPAQIKSYASVAANEAVTANGSASGGQSKVFQEIDDRESRKKNVIISGLVAEEKENLNEAVSEVLSEVGVKDATFVAKLFGKKTPKKVIVKFNDIHIRNAVMQRKSALKNSAKFSGVFFNEDLTKIQHDNLTKIYRVAEVKNEVLDIKEKFVVAGPRSNPFLLKLVLGKNKLWTPAPKVGENGSKPKLCQRV